MLFGQLVKWAGEDSGNWPGAFRDKDLNLIFEQCQQKFAILNQLRAEREELAEKLALVGSQPFSVPTSVAELKPVAEPPRKKLIEYKYKCDVKSCGKIMTSEASYLIHMKKHSEKRTKKGSSYLDLEIHENF